MPAIRQTSFLGGEFSPLLWGRTDAPRYGEGARTMRNFLPTRHGMALSRPGTEFVHATKGGLGRSMPVRLVPFVFSDTMSFVLEFGEKYIRFFHDGAVVGGPLEVVTPYLASDLKQLRWVQSGAVLTLCHPAYQVQELTVAVSGTGVVSATLVPISFALKETWWKDLASGANTMPPYLLKTASDFPFVDDVDHPPRPWKWQATAVVKDVTTGATYETAPITISRFAEAPAGSPSSIDYSTADNISTVTVENDVVLYPDRPVTIRRGAFHLASRPADADTYVVLSYNFYRGNGDVFGWVGNTKGLDFVDDGREPDYLQPPPRGRDPFSIERLSGGPVVDHPGAVAYFQDRLCFAATNVRPARWFASAVADYKNFDENTGVVVPGEAVEFDLASRRYERILALVGLQRLLVFTSSSVWSIGGAGGPLAADNVHAQVEEEIGSNGLTPLVTDTGVLYARAKGTGVRGLLFDGNSQRYQGVDLSFISSHLFTGLNPPTAQSLRDGHALDTHALVDWAYAEDPWGVVWAVREDGVLLSGTPSGNHIAWARHDTQGFVRNVCVVPEGDEDAVYLVVARTISGDADVPYIERMTSRLRTGAPTDDACVDACLEYVGAPVLTLTGLGHLEGLDVWVVGVDNIPRGPLTVTGGQVTLPELPTPNTYVLDGSGEYVKTSVTLYAGLLFTPELETLDVVSTSTRMAQKTVVKVGFEVDQSKGLWVGQDFNHLIEWRQRLVSDSYGAPSIATALVVVPVLGKWDNGARAALRQTLPLPVTVLGLTRETDTGG